MTFEDEPTHPLGIKSAAPTVSQEPSWMAYARTKLGVHEVAGAASHPFILQCYADVGLKGVLDDSTTPWCSCFVNHVIKHVGIKGTGSAAARSWLHWGEALSTPRAGCVVVLSRPPNPASGHVAFLAGIGPGDVLQLLGGNEANAVRVMAYPKARLLAYRWPTAEMLQAVQP